MKKLLMAALLALALTGCDKDEHCADGSAGTRTAVDSTSGVRITVDSTWQEDITINF